MTVAELTNEELALLKRTRSASDWNQACDLVKRARQGQYPPDWYKRVVLSGLAAQMQASW